jgi:hypothetical protein
LYTTEYATQEGVIFFIAVYFRISKSSAEELVWKSAHSYNVMPIQYNVLIFYSGLIPLNNDTFREKIPFYGTQ